MVLLRLNEKMRRRRRKGRPDKRVSSTVSACAVPRSLQHTTANLNLGNSAAMVPVTRCPFCTVQFPPPHNKRDSPSKQHQRLPRLNASIYDPVLTRRRECTAAGDRCMCPNGYTTQMQPGTAWVMQQARARCTCEARARTALAAAQACTQAAPRAARAARRRGCTSACMRGWRASAVSELSHNDSIGTAPATVRAHSSCGPGPQWRGPCAARPPLCPTAAQAWR